MFDNLQDRLSHSLKAITGQARLSEENIEQAMVQNEVAPDTVFMLDLQHCRLSFAETELPVEIAEAPRRQLLEGTWDTTAELLAAHEQIAATAHKLPYFNHWR